MVVYLDEFFLINFIMDLLVLLIVKLITSDTKSVCRTVMAAILGGLYACVILVLDIDYGIVESLFTYVVMSVLLTVIAFGSKNVKALTEKLALLFMAVFLMSGVINLAYERGWIKGLWSMTVVTVLAVIIVFFLLRYRKNCRESKENIVMVYIYNRGKSVTVSALIDTGNSLKEPITGKPVAIVTKDNALKIKAENTGIFAIPYRSVGEENGILNGFMADYMKIQRNTTEKYKKTIVVNKPIIAEYDGKLTGDDSYCMLLSPQIVREGEKNVCKGSS